MVEGSEYLVGRPEWIQETDRTMSPLLQGGRAEVEMHGEECVTVLDRVDVQVLYGSASMSSSTTCSVSPRCAAVAT